MTTNLPVPFFVEWLTVYEVWNGKNHLAPWIVYTIPEDVQPDDPDNPPLTKEELERMRRVPRARIIRRSLRLTQEEFSHRYRIPIGTLRDWEQGRATPDTVARLYLHCIASSPEAIASMVNQRRGNE